MSSIHYKFRSVKDYDTYTFEGAGIPVWELKQEIINSKRLSKATDFDLILSNAQTNQGSYCRLVPAVSSLSVARQNTRTTRPSSPKTRPLLCDACQRLRDDASFSRARCMHPSRVLRVHRVHLEHRSATKNPKLPP